MKTFILAPSSPQSVGGARQTEWQTDRRMVGGGDGRWAAVTDIHPALCEPHVTVGPSQPARKSTALVSAGREQFSSSCTGLWTQTLWPSASEVLGPMSKQLTAKQCALKGSDLFMKSFKVTAAWASCSLTAMCTEVSRAGAWLMFRSMAWLFVSVGSRGKAPLKRGGFPFKKRSSARAAGHTCTVPGQVSTMLCLRFHSA